MSSDEYKSLGHKLNSSAVEWCTFVDLHLLVIYYVCACVRAFARACVCVCVWEGGQK